MVWFIRADSRFAHSQWETSLQSNVVFHWLCANPDSTLIHRIPLPISFRVASLALGQSYDCPSACEATLKDMGKIGMCQTTTKHYKAWTTCMIVGIYCGTHGGSVLSRFKVSPVVGDCTAMHGLESQTVYARTKWLFWCLFLRCLATKEINTKTTPEWAHKPFFP